jgi:tetratricopeptide (TPR) repeat protein
MPYAGSVTLNDFLKDKADVSARGGQSLVGTVLAKITDTKIAREKSESSDGESIREQGSHFSLNPAADDDAVLRPMDAFTSFGCVELAIWIFQRLAGALAHAHARGVLHNDLKPSNVLIRNDGEPALLDFNLSQSLDRSRSGYAGGTLPYMSPETYRAMMGQDVQSRPTSDLYGLGVMLFEFVTGRQPYPTPKSIAPIDIAPAIESRSGEPDWNADDEITPGLKAIIDRCLQFEPDDRYQRADELQMDLQREQQSLSLVNTSEPLTWTIKKWTRRHPRTIWAGLVGGFLLGILIPLSMALINLKRSNAVLNSQTAFERFSDDSNEFLSAMVVDPNRQKNENISRGMSILKQYGVLQRDTIDKHLAAFQGNEKVAARETMLRHFAQLGFLEVAHLSQIRLTDPSGARNFERLDQLIAAAKMVEGDRPSRARLLLEMDRARLAGNENRHAMLQRSVIDSIPDSDAELYLDAVRLLANYDHAAASKRLTELADRNSIPSALRWTMLGRSQFAERKYEDARLSFTQSIERAPDSAKLLVLRGRCSMELHQGLAAEDDFLKAIEREPSNRTAWYCRGQIHQAREEYADAIKCYDRVLELSPGDFATLLKRSEAHRKMGRISAAEADYQKALAAECDTQMELIERAKSRCTDDPDAALDDLYQARRLNPDRPFILSRIAHMLARKLFRYEEAAEIYADVLRIQPANESAMVDRALALTRLKRFEEALELTERAMEGSNDGRNIYQAACVHALVGTETDRIKAVVLLSEAINAGYRNKNMGTDPDLESIRGMSGYRAAIRVHVLSHSRTSNSNPSENGDENLSSQLPTLEP